MLIFVFIAVNSGAQVDVVRDFQASVNPGEKFTVVLEVDVDENNKPSAYGITEIIPSGWEISNVTTQSQPLVRNVNNNKLSLVFMGSSVADQTITYKVTVPANSPAGNHAFNGSIDVLNKTTNITGDSVINLVSGNPENKSVKESKIWIDAPSMHIKNNFSVRIMVNSSADISGFDLILGYDNSKIRPVNCFPGSFLANAGNVLLSAGNNCSSNPIKFTASLTGNKNTSGRGSLLEISFEIKNNGSSALDLSGTSAYQEILFVNGLPVTGVTILDGNVNVDVSVDNAPVNTSQGNVSLNNISNVSLNNISNVSLNMSQGNVSLNNITEGSVGNVSVNTSKGNESFDKTGGAFTNNTPSISNNSISDTPNKTRINEGFNTEPIKNTNKTETQTNQTNQTNEKEKIPEEKQKPFDLTLFLIIAAASAVMVFLLYKLYKLEKK